MGRRKSAKSPAPLPTDEKQLPVLVEPADKEIHRLLERLAHLAKEWRAGSRERALVVREYHEVYRQLESLGWNGSIDLEDELPDEWMPAQYLTRHPGKMKKGAWGDPDEFYRNK